MRVLVILCSLCLLSPVYGSSIVTVYTRDKPHQIIDEFSSQESKIGAKLPSEGLRGSLVVGEPRDGCSTMNIPWNARKIGDKLIVLLARYGCCFATKVRFAELAGYDGVIVHNVNSSELLVMTARDPRGISIPAVFVTDNTGHSLAENYNYNSRFYIVLTGASARESPFVLMIAILIALLFSSS